MVAIVFMKDGLSEATRNAQIVLKNTQMLHYSNNYEGKKKKKKPDTGKMSAYKVW